MTDAAEAPIPHAASVPAGFSIEVRTQQKTIELRLAGELDVATVGQLQTELEMVIDARVPRIVIDLRRVEFIDSTGLHALLFAHSRAKHEGCQLAIIPGRPAVQRLFELAGTIDRLPFAVVDGGVSSPQI